MNARRLAVMSVLALTGAGHGGIDLDVEQVFLDDGGNALPATHVVIRVYWPADHADDQLVGVVGSPSNLLSVTVEGGTFFDSTNPIANDRPPFLATLGFPGFEELSYDSWFTIGNSSFEVGPAWPSGAPFTDQVIVSAGTAMEPALDGSTSWEGGPSGSNNSAWVVPPTLRDPGRGAVEPTPQSVAGNWPGNRVLMMQLSVVPDEPGVVSIEGGLGVLVIDPGGGGELGASFSFTLPAPSALAALAALGVVALVTRGRRRA